jgi:biotin transport system substrate-specific component
MLRTLPQTRDTTQVQRLAAIALFTLLTAVSARATIEIGPVPITLQVLTVLLAGLVLGARDGALAYVAMVAINLPVDARMVGAAALFSPTAGYLLGFIPAAWVAGLLAERGASTLWVRWLAGIAGIAVIYTLGFVMLKLNTGMAWDAAWAAGVAPFILLDLGKAIAAAALAEGGRRLINR